MIRYFEFHFSSAHFYKQSQWSEEQNRKTFGACYDPYGHGHNYRLLVGFNWDELQNLEPAESKIKEVIQLLDHHHLNHQIHEFKTQVPTTENIALYLSKKIKTALPSLKLHKLYLYEMDDLWAEVSFE